MIGKRCEMKKQYATRKRALSAAACAVRKFGTPHRAYKCNLCHLFHTTTQKLRLAVGK